MEKILDRIKQERVFSLSITSNKAFLTLLDYEYKNTISLNKQELKQLIEELIDIYKIMK